MGLILERRSLGTELDMAISLESEIVAIAGFQNRRSRITNRPEDACLDHDNGAVIQLDLIGLFAKPHRH